MGSKVILVQGVGGGVAFMVACKALPFQNDVLANEKLTKREYVGFIHCDQFSRSAEHENVIGLVS